MSNAHSNQMRGGKYILTRQNRHQRKEQYWKQSENHEKGGSSSGAHDNPECASASISVPNT